MSGDFANIDDIAELLLSGDAGSGMTRIRDIARVIRAPLEPVGEIMRWNGAPAVGIGISTVEDGNVIAMGDAVTARLETLRSRIPVGMDIHAITHQGETVKTAIGGFMFNLISAVAIVMLVLILFMGRHEGLIIGAVLLLTVLATFIGMRILDITLQRISLGALIIALGMLVDNAIVVTEGITIKARRGMDRIGAAEETVRETQWLLLAATGIAVLAFAAITLSKDMTGEWLKSLFQVIFLSLGLSWVLAITVTPFLCVMLLPATEAHPVSPYRATPYRLYRRLLSSCIAHRGATLGGTALLLCLALWGFGFVKQDFMPDMSRPQITIDVRLPEGSRIDATAAEVDAIAAHVRALDGVTDVASFVGRGPLRFLLTREPEMPCESYGQLLVGLDDSARIPELRDRLTAFLEEHHAGAVTSVDVFKLGPGGRSVVARLGGPDETILRTLAEQVKTVMSQNPNVRSLRTDWGNPVKVQSVRLAEARAREAGVSRLNIAQSLAMTFPGSIGGTFRHGDDLLPIVLRPPPSQRENVDNIDNTLVWSDARSL